MRRPPATRLLLVILPLAFAAVPASAHAASGCDGKRATIVSNAPVIRGTKAPNVIVAGPRVKRIYGEGGNDVICAGPGNNTVYGGRGDDTIFGEGGNDVIHGERGSDHLEGGPGEDRVFGDSGNDTVEGGAGSHDLVEGDAGDDTVSGGAGDYDVVIGGVGNDKIDGGPGEHDIASYQGTAGALTINLTTGTVSGAESEHLTGIEDAIGGAGNDTLIGSSVPNRLDGGPGNDRLEAVGAGDEAFGGPGSDSCEGPFVATESCGPTKGGEGTAVELYRSIAGGASLIVTGNAQVDDVTVGRVGSDYVVKGQPGGNPVLLGDPESPSCSLNAAADTATCAGPISSILASLGAGDDSFAEEASVPASVTATIEGGPGSDTLRGGAGNDVLYAGEDSVPDTLEGGGGNDVLFGVNAAHPRKDSGPARMLGGPGNDLMVGGQPCDGDLFDGGPGANDSASFSRVHNSGVFVEATIGGAVLDPDVSHCDEGHITASTEKVEGSPGPDILTGDNGPNVLLGRGGNDRLNGKGGYDRCVGGGGHDRATNCEFTASVP